MHDPDPDSPPTVEKARKGYEEGNTDLCGLGADTDSYSGEYGLTCRKPECDLLGVATCPASCWNEVGMGRDGTGRGIEEGEDRATTL